MKLLSLELSGFRGFSKHCEFDLDADAIVVVGANGHGKTSLFDGILWALSGRIPRLRNNNNHIVSMYSETGEARARLSFREPSTGYQFTITRKSDGKNEQLLLEVPDSSYQGPAAKEKLIDLIWPEAALSSDPNDAFTTVLTQSIYLQQDIIRQFIDTSTEQDRFGVFSELLGAGRVIELQKNLERAKRAWTMVTNQCQDELNPINKRLTETNTRLAVYASFSSQTIPMISSEEWEQWWQSVSRVGLKNVQVEIASSEASAAIDIAIKQLAVLRDSAERRVHELVTIKSTIDKLDQQPMQLIAQLREKEAILHEQLAALKRVVNDEQQRLTEIRRHQALLKEKTEQLKTLAALALRHLEDRCPVCAQAYDKDATQQRLEAIIKGEIGDVQEALHSDNLTEHLNALAKKERETTNTELELRTAERTLNELQLAQRALSVRLNELGIIENNSDMRPAVDKAINEANTSIRSIQELRQIGESMAVRLAQLSSVAEMEKLGKEAEALRQESLVKERNISARIQTGQEAQRVIEALREAALALAVKMSSKIDPLFHKIYTKLDPHPVFRSVNLETQIFRGKGQLSISVSDPIEKKQSCFPDAIFSSSQVNALAVSVFLALNIGLAKPPLSIAILDDPLQSLDDINLLGLVDLLRRAKDQRQLFVSTHDERFGGLISRKLRPSSKNGRTILIKLDSWSRQGPVVETREVTCDPVPFRLVASRAA